MTKVNNPMEEINERIEDIQDLNYLKKYACPKYQHKREWYLECVDCKNKKTCKAGRQAIFLMNNETTPVVKESVMSPQELQEKKKREEIETIFKQKDPIKYLLENSTNIKPQSVYQRVNLWRKNFPDLQEKYQMIEKVRFLWTKPYDSMTVPEILNELYPKRDSDEHGELKSKRDSDEYGESKSETVSMKKEEEKKKESPLVSYTDIAPNSKIFTVQPDPKDDSDDSISLEDFLKETSEDEDDAEREAKEVSAQMAIQEAGTNNDVSSITQLAKKLENEMRMHEEKIKEIKGQLEAIKTVQKLMAG